MKRWLMVLIALILVGFTANGCGWMGRTTAKAEKGIEKGVDAISNSIDEFKNGYQEEREKK